MAGDFGDFRVFMCEEWVGGRTREGRGLALKVIQLAVVSYTTQSLANRPPGAAYNNIKGGVFTF